MIWFTAEELEQAASVRRNNPVAPYVIADTMDTLKHPGDGRFYDSKSSFNQTSKALGLVPWEEPKDWNADGTYRSPDEKLIEEDINQAIERAYNDIKWDNVQLTDEQQVFAKETNEKIKAVTGKDPKLD